MHNIEIYCKEKHNRWVIATMHKSQVGTQGKWVQPTPASKEREREIMQYEMKRLAKGAEYAVARDLIRMKLDPEGYRKEFDARPRPDKPVSYTYILNGESIGEDPPFRTNPGDDLYLKYEFGCPKCHGDSKPLQRRESKLIPVLDALAETGVEAVSFQKLSQWCTIYDQTR